MSKKTIKMPYQEYLNDLTESEMTGFDEACKSILKALKNNDYLQDALLESSQDTPFFKVINKINEMKEALAEYEEDEVEENEHMWQEPNEGPSLGDYMMTNENIND